MIDVNTKSVCASGRLTEVRLLPCPKIPAERFKVDNWLYIQPAPDGSLAGFEKIKTLSIL